MCKAEDVVVEVRITCSTQTGAKDHNSSVGSDTCEIQDSQALSLNDMYEFNGL